MRRAVMLISVEGVAGHDGLVRRREFQVGWAVEFRGVRIRMEGKGGEFGSSVRGNLGVDRSRSMVGMGGSTDVGWMWVKLRGVMGEDSIGR